MVVDTLFTNSQSRSAIKGPFRMLLLVSQCNAPSQASWTSFVSASSSAVILTPMAGKDTETRRMHRQRLKHSVKPQPWRKRHSTGTRSHRRSRKDLNGGEHLGGVFSLNADVSGDGPDNLRHRTRPAVRRFRGVPSDIADWGEALGFPVVSTAAPGGRTGVLQSASLARCCLLTPPWQHIFGVGEECIVPECDIVKVVFYVGRVMTAGDGTADVTRHCPAMVLPLLRVTCALITGWPLSCVARKQRPDLHVV
ncbi:unnamed protein product [Lampetra fluviatilis]